ncbi:3'-5' exonuclease [Streptomyces sp. 1222.5]|uniref:3'-5' exonuclease n=1 Tax=Streptomyces sp. 1222.5 TaxID=1881026 RepID=UPI003D764719
MQTTHEAHRELVDAVLALRRPASWTREREQVVAWARRLLAGDSFMAIEVETTGLEYAYAVQIAAVDRRGSVVFNEYVQPNAALEPAAVAVHGITPDRLAQAPACGDLLPRLTEVLHGRVAVAYKLDFDRGVIERELRCHHRGEPVAGPHPVVKGPSPHEYRRRAGGVRVAPSNAPRRPEVTSDGSVHAVAVPIGAAPSVKERSAGGASCHSGRLAWSRATSEARSSSSSRSRAAHCSVRAWPLAYRSPSMPPTATSTPSARG